MKHSILASLSVLALCIGCAQPESGYNRGTGVYPGNPDEDFSPKMVVDNEYRNIALHRAVFNSSSFDYYLTGTLVTDGIVEENLPEYLTVETNTGKPIKRETEWLVDGHRYTRIHQDGSKMYYQLNFHNGWTLEFDRMKFDGYVSYIEKNTDKKHEVVFSYSPDQSPVFFVSLQEIWVQS